MKITLGFKPRYWSAPTPEPDKDDEEKELPTVYPSMSIQGEAADKLIQSGKLSLGSTITATVTFRVTEVRGRVEKNSEYGNDPYGDGSTIELEVQSISDVSREKEKEEPEEDAGEALDKFLKDSKK